MTNLDVFKHEMKNKDVTVIGIGVSNIPLIKYLVKLGAVVTARDEHTADVIGDVCAELENMGVTLRLGEDYLEDLSGSVIFKTPGMRYDVPELLAAKERGSKITSEMEVFFDVCPSHIIAVTGSDGKTTTTTLIHKMLTDAGYKTWLGGNIGNPLLSDAGEMAKDDWVVLELSSFQLHTMRKSPEIAVITNISPNHLDVHKDYAEYIEAKKNIMMYQKEGDILVLNLDNEETAKLVPETKGAVRTFSRRGNADVYLDGNVIKRGEVSVLGIDEIKIPGMHNVENYMAAIAAVSHLVNDDIIRNIARTFGGVEHRIELVRELDGVKYYNSSIDSSPNRTKNTLSVFSEKVVLIAGGKDKGIPFDSLGPSVAEHVKTLILIGMTSDKIKKALLKETAKTGKGKDIEIIHASSYEDAVNTARAKASPGDVVLLSPASTSYDAFKNFAERGALFKKLVNELK